MKFDQEILLDPDSTDDEIEEQLELFVIEGGKGADLVKIMMYNTRGGVSQQTHRILDILGKMDP